MSRQPFDDFAQPQPDDRSGWYLRVSTPKQKLEHQREHFVRFCEQHDNRILDELRFERQKTRSGDLK